MPSSPKILVAVKSCNRDRLAGCHTAIRDTWGKDFPSNVDVRFFVGHGHGASDLLPDEIAVDTPDDLVALPLKVREIAKHSGANGYDYTFLCDVDTFVIPSRLLASGFEGYDYFGRFMVDGPATPIRNFQDGRIGIIPFAWNYASGGVGYFLSKRAAELIAKMVPVHYAEDFSVGHALGPSIQAGKLTVEYPKPFDGYVAWHYGVWSRSKYVWPHSVGFEPQWMYDSYAKGQP
jgi:hypothetical protein